MIDYINRYVRPDLPQGYSIDFIDYDWRVNGQPDQGRCDRYAMGGPGLVDAVSAAGDYRRMYAQPACCRRINSSTPRSTSCTSGRS